MYLFEPPIQVSLTYDFIIKSRDGDTWQLIFISVVFLDINHSIIYCNIQNIQIGNIYIAINIYLTIEINQYIELDY